MTAFAAQPGFHLVSLDATDPTYPIIGWLHTTGLNVVPMVLGHPGPLTAGEGIEAENGTVFDPATGQSFGDVESWRDDFNENPTYRIGSPIKTLLVPEPAASAPSVAVNVANEKPTASTLDFSGKVYQKASFWRANVGGRDLVFVLTPGIPAPQAPAEKITREAFYEARKTISEVQVATLMQPADDQPELPLGETDDDGDDLI